jgi:hypothetical protein
MIFSVMGRNLDFIAASRGSVGFNVSVSFYFFNEKGVQVVQVRGVSHRCYSCVESYMISTIDVA